MAKIVALHYFAVVTRCSSLRDAASQLDIHPNVLARHISQLEYYMDAPLLERGPLGIRLTAAGELLAAKLDRTINELDHVVRLIDDLKGLRGGLVGVHAAEGVASAILVPVLSAFAGRHPHVRARLRTGTAKDAVRAIEDASCDIALTFFAPPSDAVTVAQRIWLPQFIIAPPDHPVTRPGGASLPALAGYRWVLPGRISASAPSSTGRRPRRDAGSCRPSRPRPSISSAPSWPRPAHWRFCRAPRSPTSSPPAP